MAINPARLDLWIGVSGTSDSERAVLIERFVALKNQLPWLYGILFVNVLGLHLTLAQEVEVSGMPAMLFLSVIGGRGLYWLLVNRPLHSLEIIRRELRRTFLICLAFCLSVCAWSLNLFWMVEGPHRIEVVIFASLAAIGSCYALTAFPAAAKVPLLVLALPLAMALAIVSRMAHAGLGVSLVVLIMVTLRLLKVQEAGFVRLVRSRLAIDIERQRAVEAQKLAIAEQRRAKLIANSDALTGLANRRGFLASFDHLNSSYRKTLALILIDLDGFKPINDTFGHAAGDALLIDVSRRLEAVGTGGTTVARLGGDEFAMVSQCADAEQAFDIASEAVATLNVPYSLDGRTLSVSACAGVSFQGDDNLADAMRRADLALYRSKRGGRGHVTLFTEDMDQDIQRRTSIEQALREPGIDIDIELVFQPIFRLETMEICSFEALARWNHRYLGKISPAEFIPITEQSSVLDSMTEALLRRATNAAHDWPDHILLSFNLSAVQLCSAGYDARILSVLEDQEFAAHRLQIEVTETALLGDFEAARDNLSNLRQRGVRIVLDDFGAGYSSISYLREIQFDAVKLDGSLVTGMDDLGSGLPLLRGVLALCSEIGLPCVAEHIETPKQLNQLKHMGCSYGQGFGLSHPLDAAGAGSLAWSMAGSKRAQAAA